MSSSFKIASNTVYQLLAKSVSVFSTVLTTALITRAMGISSFGTFFLMTGFAAYFFLLLDFGINTVATRDITAEKSLTVRYFSNILALRLLFSLALILAISLVLPFIPFRLENTSMLRVGIFIGLLTLVSQAIYNSCGIIFQSDLIYEKSVLASLVGNLSFLFLSILIIFSRGSLLLLVAANTFGAVLVSLTSLLLVKRSIGPFSLRFDFSLWKKLTASSFPLGLTIVFTVIVAKADSFLLSVLDLSRLRLSNELALGGYGLAYKVFENILVFPTFFVNALFPVMVAHGKESAAKIKLTLTRSLIFILLASVVVLSVGYIFSPAIIYILSGKADFSQTVLALKLLILSLPFFFLSSVLLFFLVTVGREGVLPFVYGLAAAVNILLNIYFIPFYGFLASAVITGFTELLILVLLSYFSFAHFRSTTDGKN